MSDDMYVKHPDHMGMNLRLHIGRGDKTIFDNEILEGPKWERFVRMGFLRKCSEEEVEQILAGRIAVNQARADHSKAVEAVEVAKAVNGDEKAGKAPANRQEALEAVNGDEKAGKAPANRQEALEAMDVDDLYKIVQALELPGRSKLKGDKDGLVSAILGSEEKEAESAADALSGGTVTKSPAPGMDPAG